VLPLRKVLLRGGGLRLGVLAAEALDAARGIDQLLLAGEERVAVGADFRVDVAFVRGARAEGIATRAHNANFVIVRMNSLLWHDARFQTFRCNPFILAEKRTAGKKSRGGPLSRAGTDGREATSPG
jgi:hypothetical protein